MKMSCQVWAVAIVTLLGCFQPQARADSIALRDGRSIQGKFAGGTQGVIAFTVDGAMQYYEVRSIVMMTFGEESADSQEGPMHPNAPHQSPTVPPVLLPDSSHELGAVSPRLVRGSISNRHKAIQIKRE